MESSLSALKLSGDSPLTELCAERMEQKKPEHSEYAADKQTSKKAHYENRQVIRSLVEVNVQALDTT